MGWCKEEMEKPSNEKSASADPKQEPKTMPASKRKPVLITAVCLVAVVLVGTGAFLGTWLSGRNAEPEPEPPEPIVIREYVPREVGTRGVVVTEDNFEDILEQATEVARRFGHFRTRMSNDWVFETATSPSVNVFVENHESNPGTVFFDLMLDDVVLYSSPYIPLGERLDSITLDVELAPGEYNPVVIYHLVDENYEVQATLSVGITLRILG